MAEEQDCAKRQCVPKKCASTRRTPIEGTLTEFLEKYAISKEEWETGRLSSKGINEIPHLLPWPEGLTTLYLNNNKTCRLPGN